MQPHQRPFGRRRFIHLGAAAAVLAACGDDDSAATPTSADGDAPTTTASATTTAAPTDPASISGRLVMANYPDYVAEETYAAFEAAYPNIEIVRSDYTSEAEALTRLATGANSEWDLVVLGGTTARQAFDEGLLREIDRSRLPNMAGIDPALFEQDFDPGSRFSVPKNFGITGIGFDSDVVEAAPRNWQEFFEKLPAHAPETMMLDGPLELLAPAAQSLGFPYGEPDEVRIRAAGEVLIDAKPHIGIVAGGLDWYGRVGDGSAKLFSGYNGDLARMKAFIPSLEFQIPEGERDFWTGVWVIPDEAPNADAAYAWIDFLLQPEIAAQEMAFSYFPVSVPAAWDLVPAELRDLDYLFPTAEELRTYTALLVSPETLRIYNEVYSEFQAA